MKTGYFINDAYEYRWVNDSEKYRLEYRNRENDERPHWTVVNNIPTKILVPAIRALLDLIESEYTNEPYCPTIQQYLAGLKIGIESNSERMRQLEEIANKAQQIKEYQSFESMFGRMGAQLDRALEE